MSKGEQDLVLPPNSYSLVMLMTFDELMKSWLYPPIDSLKVDEDWFHMEDGGTKEYKLCVSNDAPCFSISVGCCLMNVVSIVFEFYKLLKDKYAIFFSREDELNDDKSSSLVNMQGLQSYQDQLKIQVKHYSSSCSPDEYNDLVSNKYMLDVKDFKKMLAGNLYSTKSFQEVRSVVMIPLMKYHPQWDSDLVHSFSNTFGGDIGGIFMPKSRHGGA